MNFIVFIDDVTLYQGKWLTIDLFKKDEVAIAMADVKTIRHLVIQAKHSDSIKNQ